MFHKEGGKIILFSTTLTVVILLLSGKYIELFLLQKSIQIATLLLLILVLQFFRNPIRNTIQNPNQIIGNGLELHVLRLLFYRLQFENKSRRQWSLHC